MDHNGENKNQRVVITGLGVISSLGIGWQDFWKNLTAGKSGISRISSFDTSKYDRHYGGEVKDFKAEDYIHKRKIQYFNRTSQMAVVASKLALSDGQIKEYDLKDRTMGVCIGTTMGEPQVMEDLDEKLFPKGENLKVDRLSAATYPACSISHNIANHFKLNGPNFVFSSACAAGNYAIQIGRSHV